MDANEVESPVMRRIEVAKYLKVSLATLHRMINDRSRKFPRPLNIGPNSVGFLKSEIDAWLAKLPRQM